MNYKMIVLDLDGTLTNRDKVITPRTKQSLMEAQKRGIKVVLASGRPTYGVVPLAQELELENYGGYILSFNGGMITDCCTRKAIFKQELPVEANRRIVELAKKEQVDILTYQDTQILTNNPENRYAKLESRINHLKLKQVDNLEEYLDFPVPKFLMLDDGDYLALVEARVKAALGKNFSVYRSDPFFLEILPRNIDKAQSLAQLLKLLGMEREEMIACGDGYNDLSMIEFAGLGVAMENAVRPVRSAADYVTFSNNDDGVAHVVEKFLLYTDRHFLN
ncbi:Cof-type HAD-IIB family hydrolase [Candidatus Ventrimonas sp.]|uniref:Cof-type HAD-IIB family hydrolase n=1 Tax=Candidatus Ventrimonas sp. TaxID=3048889 RepID=UPI003AB899D2